MGRVIAIDPGYSNLGYAVGEKPNKLITCGTLYFKGKDRLREIYLRISDLFKEHKPERVVIEDFRVYQEQNKGKHKTSMAIGVIVACAYEHGARIELKAHNSWKAEFKRVYSVAWVRLPPEWKNGLRNGSEHSRDAVMMLLLQVGDLKAMLTGGKKNGGVNR